MVFSVRFRQDNEHGARWFPPRNEIAVWGDAF